MASNINPNNINGNYPVAGQDNDSQGFRDNFTNISNNFSFAATEITGLQNAMTNVQSTVATDGNVTAYYGNVQQDLIVGGTTTLGGVVYVGSNVALTDGTAGLTTVYPTTNQGYDLGTSTLQFGNTYSANVYANVSSVVSSIHSYEVDQTKLVGASPSAVQAISVYDGCRWMFTANAANNCTLNFVGVGNAIAVGQTVKIEVAIANGATPYYPSAHQIDGVAQTSIKWLNGTVPTTGNANATNLYNYTITKTSTAPAYSIFGLKSTYQ
jgi:hypothetical protein